MKKNMRKVAALGQHVAEVKAKVLPEERQN